MKRVLFALLTLVVLVGCAPVAPKVTVNELFGSIDNSQLNIVKFIEIGSEYVVLELNGQQHKVTPDSEYIENDSYLVQFSDSGESIFSVRDLFDRLVGEWEINPSMEYYILRDYQRSKSLEEPTSYNPMDEAALAIVLVPVEEMPKVVDWKSWIGTEASLQVWEYPHRYPWVVQNLTTGEIAFFKCSIVNRDVNGVEDYADRSAVYQGFISEEKDGNGCPVLVISSSK